MPTDRNRRPTEARTSGSSSMTNTVAFASDIAAAGIKGSGNQALSRFAVWPSLAVLVPIPGPEQPTFFLGTRGVDQSLRGADTARRPRLAPSADLSRRNKP